MNNSEEWKSLWSISSVHSPPLLLSPATTTEKIGPLIFNPSSKPETHHHLFTSPSVPHIPPPVSNLSLSRFLHTSSSVLPSTTTSIASHLSSSYSNPEQLFAYNSLQLLQCPGTDSTLAFFPIGSNLDQVGCVILSVENSQLKVIGDDGVFEPFTTKNTLNHRILKISVNPLADCDCNLGDSTIGYLLVSTTYSVYYYNIRIKMDDSGEITPILTLIADKLFKSCAVVHACWSPHLPEESLVLLDNGDLFLFDLDSCCVPSISPRLIGNKVKVLWDDSTISEKGGWLSCDFSWHPRILIVAHSSVVFLVDSRSEKCTVIPLLKHATNDKFVAFSIAAPDRFYFTLASNQTVFLCDIRKPMIPLLHWTHYVHNPSYITVSSMSKLRSQCEDTTYSWASESGYFILLGSFWNSEFSLFCYGPDVSSPVSSLGCGKSFYAWGLPSDLSLVTNECRCGSCIVKEEFSKDMLPKWINWQQKKEFILGFGILDSEISSQLFEPDGFGGFTLITFTSSGNLESHRYCATWDYSKASENGHGNQALDLEESFLYETGEENYKFKKIFVYLKLDWLDGYLKSDLARILSKELVKNPDRECPKKGPFGQDFHEIICQKLKTFRSGGSLNIHDVFSDVSLPTSIHEIALRRVWANLPKKYLQFGFSTYSNLPDVPMKLKNLPLEFLEVPCQQSHLPPFFFRSPSFRSCKWSDKKKPGNSLVGPVIPVPFLVTFHKTHMLKADNLSADFEIDQECDKVMRVANEVTGSESEPFNDIAVSLADDNEDMFYGSQNQQKFGSYKLSMEDSVFKDEKHTNLVFRIGQKDVKEIFDSQCPLKFKFDEEGTSFGPKEMMSYKLLKRQYSNFKEGFSSYQDYIKSNIH